jgi:tRNA(Ile)-lysidine synthase
MPPDLFESFKSALERHALWVPPEAVLVAVSGGSDSVALLHLFGRLRAETPFPLSVAHLNHALRGKESDMDEAFVGELAARHQVPWFTRRLSPGQLGDAAEGMEAAARRARYDFLRETAGRIGAARVALGHTRDDQAETFLLRLLRGAGPRGLGGIYPSLHGVFIRPLLEISRESLQLHLRESGVSWREDSSNQDLARTRNRIRHQLLPWLQSQYNPEIDEVLSRTTGVLRDEEEYLDSVTRELARRLVREEEQGLSLAVPAVRVLPPALRRRLLRSFLERATGEPCPPPDFETTSALEALVREGRHQAAITIASGLEIRVVYSDLVALLRPAPVPQASVPLPVPGEAALPELGLRLSARQVSLAEAGDPKRLRSAGRAFLDADALPGPLEVRRRREGDHFRPLGAPGESKLKAFLIDRKVPQPVRDRIPLVVAGDQIAWVVGYQIDDRFKVTKRTRRVLVLSKELP